jgi:hypothetical protein
MTAAELMLALLRFELNRVPLTKENKAALSVKAQKELLTLAKRHQVVSLVADALFQSDCLLDPGVAEECQAQRRLAIMRYLQHEYAIERFRAAFNRLGIPFILLKGSVLCHRYPQEWMRSNSDVDILVRPVDLERAMATATRDLGCVITKRTSHDVSLMYGDVLIELHYELVEDGRANRAQRVLKQVWDHASEKQDSEYILSDEMFYFYHMAHMAKHFEATGCVARYFLDVWLLNRSGFDAQKREGLLEQGQLLLFAKGVGNLADAWMTGRPLTADEALLHRFVLGQDAQGAVDRWIKISQSGESKPVFWFKRVFLPYAHMRNVYPVLQTHKWLLPFLWVRRWGKVLIRRDREKAIRQWQISHNTDRQEIESTQKLMETLGL